MRLGALRFAESNGSSDCETRLVRSLEEQGRPVLLACASRSVPCQHCEDTASDEQLSNALNLKVERHRVLISATLETAHHN